MLPDCQRSKKVNVLCSLRTRGSHWVMQAVTLRELSPARTPRRSSACSCSRCCVARWRSWALHPTDEGGRRSAADSILGCVHAAAAAAESETAETNFKAPARPSACTTTRYAPSRTTTRPGQLKSAEQSRPHLLESTTAKAKRTSAC